MSWLLLLLVVVVLMDCSTAQHNRYDGVKSVALNKGRRDDILASFVILTQLRLNARWQLKPMGLYFLGGPDAGHPKVVSV